MAPFTLGQHGRGSSTLDWRLLSRSPVALYLRAQYQAEDAAQLTGLGYVVRTFDCSRWTSRDVMYDDLRTGFCLPQSVANLNALRDVLEDIAVPDEGGMAVLFQSIDAALDRVEPVLEALAWASRYWLLFGRRFVVLAQTHDPRYQGPNNLAAAPAQWNPREGLNADRRIG